MSPEAQIITDEIKSIKNDLDRSNDTSPDYLPTDIKELRSHILQVHATFETCMEIVIWQVTVKNLKVALVDTENGVIGVTGAVPGPRKGIVIIKEAK